MTKIVIPCAIGGLEPETRAWGEAHGAQFADLTGDEAAYYRLLARLWREGETFVVVEQDVVPPDGALEGFAECLRPWCFHPYYYLGSWRPPTSVPLGCTRFSANLLRSHKDVISVLLAQWGFRGKPRDYRHWSLLSQRVKMQLTSRGVIPHEHEPYATHRKTNESYLHQVARDLAWDIRRLATLMKGYLDDRQLFEAALCGLWGLPPYEVPEDVLQLWRILFRTEPPADLVDYCLSEHAS